MMLKLKGDVIVFGGPSLEHISKENFNTVDFRPPIKKGDLDELLNKKPGTCLIIDGLFGSNLSISPMECKFLLEEGWKVIGSASMGALRAADLWLLGMVGIGDVYNLYRLGECRSDADVAVLYTQDSHNEYREITASIVHLRFILQQMEDKHIIEDTFSRRLLKASKDIIWYERTWDLLWAVWIDMKVSSYALTFARKASTNPLMHPKKNDALLALKTIVAKRWI